MHSLILKFKWEGIKYVGGNTHFSHYPLKSQIFIPLKFSFPPKLGGIELDLMNFLLKLTKYPYIFNPLF